MTLLYRQRVVSNGTSGGVRRAGCGGSVGLESLADAYADDGIGALHGHHGDRQNAPARERVEADLGLGTCPTRRRRRGTYAAPVRVNE
jgi:hypothetical protein